MTYKRKAKKEIKKEFKKIRENYIKEKVKTRLKSKINTIGVKINLLMYNKLVKECNKRDITISEYLRKLINKSLKGGFKK